MFDQCMATPVFFVIFYLLCKRVPHHVVSVRLCGFIYKVGRTHVSRTKVHELSLFVTMSDLTAYQRFIVASLKFGSLTMFTKRRQNPKIKDVCDQ